MTRVVLVLSRRHGYRTSVPTDDPNEADFQGLSKDSALAQRPYDERGQLLVDERGVPLIENPPLKDLTFTKSSYQHLVTYQSDDKRVELTLHVDRVGWHTAAPELVVDVPI